MCITMCLKCIFGFEQISAKVRLFWQLINLNLINCTWAFILTLLKQIYAQKIQLQSLKCPLARAIKENIFKYLFAKFGPGLHKTNMRYINRKMGQGFHFRGQNIHLSILTGALVANHYIMGHLTYKSTNNMLNLC